MSAFLFFLGGVAAAVATELVILRLSSAAQRQLARTSIGRRIARHASDRRQVQVPSDQWSTTIGAFSFPWVVVRHGPFSHQQVEGTFDPNPVPYPEAMRHRIAEMRSDREAEWRVGKTSPGDELGWRLLAFDPPSLATHPTTSLGLHFGPTSRYEMLATELTLDDPLVGDSTAREIYSAEIDLRVSPSGVVAAFWGIGLAVVTSDRRLVLAERSDAVFESPGTVWPAVAEGGNRDADSDTRGAPDHFLLARRGADEELGVPIELSQLTWLGFGASASEWAYGLVGLLAVDYSAAELRERRSIGLPIHAQENQSLIDCAFDPDAVVELLNELRRPVSPFTLATVLHALVYKFGYDSCARAFNKATFKSM